MINSQQIQEIASYLEKAENPLFFFDDDPDGLAAALTLYKKYGRGNLVPLKVAVTLDQAIYLAKIEEYSPDIIFVLDRPIIMQETIDQIHVPIIWLDHHEAIKRMGVHYYNPTENDKNDNRCTSYWAYKVAGTPETEWIAAVGIFADWMMPDFLATFKYKDLVEGKTSPPEVMFDSAYGKIIRAFSYVLKGETKTMKGNIEALKKVQTPYEILNQETSAGKLIYTNYEKFNKEYSSLLTKALDQAKKEPGELFLFTYPSTKTSFTGELSNELLYRLTSYNYFIVGREKDGTLRMSIRSRTHPIRDALKKSVGEVGGFGGGHPLACGGSIRTEEQTRFIATLKQELNKHTQQTR